MLDPCLRIFMFILGLHAIVMENVKKYDVSFSSLSVFWICSSIL